MLAARAAPTICTGNTTGGYGDTDGFGCGAGRSVTTTTRFTRDHVAPSGARVVAKASSSVKRSNETLIRPCTSGATAMFAP